MSKLTQISTAWPAHPEPSYIQAFPADAPIVSIIVISYNQASFIEGTIQSILNQKYPGLELIVVDGGSTDDTLKILEPYREKFSILISEKDSGQTHALNKGIELASGEWIGWQNSDDYYGPNALQGLYQNVVSASQPSDVIYGQCLYVDANRAFKRVRPTGPFNPLKMLPNAIVCNQSAFFNRRIFDDGHRFDESYNFCMDLDFFMRLHREGYSFAYEPSIVGIYTDHDQTKTSRLYDVWANEILKLLKNVAKDTRFTDSERRSAIQAIGDVAKTHYSRRESEHFREALQAYKLFGGKLGLEWGLRVALSSLRFKGRRS